MEIELKEFLKDIKSSEEIAEIDFEKIQGFEDVKKEIIENPNNTLKLIEEFIEKRDNSKYIRARLKNLPASREIKLKHLRSRHLNELVVVEGIVEYSSDVRPQVVNAKFECPSCGTIISVLQIEKKFTEPSKCSCGCDGGFKLFSKEMVDTQRLVLGEFPEYLSEKEESSALNIFLKEDLVEPKMEEKTIPGARIKVIGILVETPVALEFGGLSTRFQLAIEANNLFLSEKEK